MPEINRGIQVTERPFKVSFRGYALTVFSE
jgi:hypothetical protein